MKNLFGNGVLGRRGVVAKGSAETGDGWLDDYLPYQLYSLAGRLNRRLQNRLRSQDIKVSHWRVLSVLRSAGSLTVGKIAELALMEQPTVSRVIVQLEADGLVTRAAAPQDSRATVVTLTATGIETLGTIIPTAHRHQQEALSGFTEKDLKLLGEMLRRIDQNIDLYQ